MDNLPALDRAMLSQSCKFLVRAHTARDPDMACKCFNTAIRAMETIRAGLKTPSRPRTATAGLAKHLAKMAHEKASP
jgi:hypothetical protein